MAAIGRNQSTNVNNEGWIGSIDEARLSAVVRSAAWTKFEYNNIASGTNELTWSGEQSTQTVAESSLAMARTTIVAGTIATLTAQLSSPVAGRSVVFVDDTTSTTIGIAQTNASGTASICYPIAADAVTG